MIWETPRLVLLATAMHVAEGFSGDNIDLDAYDEPLGRYS